MNRSAVDRAEHGHADLGVGGALEHGGHEQQQEAGRLRDRDDAEGLERVHALESDVAIALLWK